ncbi:CBS domain-containing protein, partial [Bifidobacterium sp.]|uniref:CBS domain-containing protein n=1 Tax=Bifidobacterium sp. TaxID=41200 RepID=UPI00257E3CCD
VSPGNGSTMVVFDDETVASKVQALSGKKVMDIATRKVVAVTPAQHVGEVARILAKKQFKKLPVVDGDGRLVGVIRRKSVMEHAFDALFPKDDR